MIWIRNAESGSLWHLQHSFQQSGTLAQCGATLYRITHTWALDRLPDEFPYYCPTCLKIYNATSPGHARVPERMAGIDKDAYVKDLQSRYGEYPLPWVRLHDHPGYALVPPSSAEDYYKDLQTWLRYTGITAHPKPVTIPIKLDATKGTTQMDKKMTETKHFRIWNNSSQCWAFDPATKAEAFFDKKSAEAALIRLAEAAPQNAHHFVLYASVGVGRAKVTVEEQ